MEAAMTIELVPLATARVTLTQPFVMNETPAGSRWIVECADFTLDGERLRAKQKGHAAADWCAVGPDGTGTLDVRALFETDDGALVFVQYNGRIDLAGDASVVYNAPRFETGDERYRWLNKIQAVGKGVLDGNTLTYELYEVR
jgi:hypothetical protein